MAVAILMMNMHGAVCASDRDMTILCYNKDEAPFAVMVDPNSKLPWEDIFDKFRVRHPDLTEDYVGTFKEYLEDYLSEYTKQTKERLNEQLFCICYDRTNVYDPYQELFPFVSCLTVHHMEGDSVEIQIRESRQIEPNDSVYVDWLGSLNYMWLLIGKIKMDSKCIFPIYKHLVNDFKNRMIESAKTDNKHEKIELLLGCIDFEVELDKVIKRLEGHRVGEDYANAIASYHIEDMVKMVESLIDAENQQCHLLQPEESIGYTKEIATLTLAEGFKWIKLNGNVL